MPLAWGRVISPWPAGIADTNRHDFTGTKKDEKRSVNVIRAWYKPLSDGDSFKDDLELSFAEILNSLRSDRQDFGRSISFRSSKNSSNRLKQVHTRHS